MRTVDVKVFGIEELNEKAKNYAYHKWLESGIYPWSTENRNTLDEFVSIFPIKVIDWEYGDGNPHAKVIFTGDENIENLTGIRLYTYLCNNYDHYLSKGKTYYKFTSDGKCIKHTSKLLMDYEYVLTGYFVDEAILAPIRHFFLVPSNTMTFKQLMVDCINNWLYCCDEDYQCCTSMEYFMDESAANGWEYMEDGNLYSDSVYKTA